jgi:hypothetical protein
MSLIGKIIYKLYFERKAKKAYHEKFGGRQNYLRMLLAEEEMKDFALQQLEIPQNSNANGKFIINFLTGDQFIHQSLFCTYSFFKQLLPAEFADFSVNYYSDGNLSNTTLGILNKRFPAINVIEIAASQQRLKRHLPRSSFPYLNDKVETLPLFKKLVYPNLEGEGLSIFFDSDMLFSRRPAAFIDWLYQAAGRPDQAFCIQDVQRSYGYSDEEIAKVWPVPVKNKVNSGLYATDHRNIDLHLIESLVKDFETKLGSQYYMEQLITAILLEKTGNLLVAPPADYIVYPSAGQVMRQDGVLQHYVNESKEFYFKEAWKKQLTRI